MNAPDKKNRLESSADSAHTHQSFSLTDAMLGQRDALRHVRTPWVDKNTLALAWRCHVDTATRRCREAGVQERAVVGPDKKARVEFWLDDVVERVVV